MCMRIKVSFVLYILLLSISCVSSPKKRGSFYFEDKEFAAKKSKEFNLDPTSGNAVLYDIGLEGSYLPSGELLLSERTSAAHESLPYGTMLWVLNPKSNRQILVKINDRLSQKELGEKVVLQVTQKVATSLKIPKGQNKFFVKFSLKQFETVPVFQIPAILPPPKKTHTNKPQISPKEKPILTEEQSKFPYKFFSDELKPEDYFVQLGAFSTLERAKIFKKDNTEMFKYSLYLGEKKFGKENTLYVVVTSFQNKELSYDFFDRLKDLGIDVLAPQQIP